MLELNNLEVAYHSAAPVLRGLSLRVPLGAVVALIGPNGAGKTTVLRAITGLLKLQRGRATKGEVLFNGQALLGKHGEDIVRAGIAQVLEGRRIFMNLSVEENLRAGGYRSTGPEVSADLDRFYTRFPALGAHRKQPAARLSGAEQQMLTIARALMARPKLLLLDEPSLGHSPKVIALLEELIRELNGEGLSILLAEQNAAMALDLSHHAYVMEHGKVVLDGSTAILRADRTIQACYLGVGQREAPHSLRDARLYPRKKRWLS
ncbi:MAG: ABC transporter ATP-binding protein [Myxococcales bacterium]|nr:ABC transporter ATP-binding protein [Myxococcales bacterium]